METAQYFKKARAETVVTLSINEPQAKPAAAPIIVTSAVLTGLKRGRCDGDSAEISNALEESKAAQAQSKPKAINPAIGAAIGAWPCSN